MARRKKKERSPEAFIQRVLENLGFNEGLEEYQQAREVLEAELSTFDPTGVLRFTLEHPSLWWWRAKVVGVTDGDTMDVFLDRGFRDTHQERIRLHRVNAWETRGKERPEGLKASRWAKKILTTNRELLVHTTGPDDRGNFGRWLAQLWVPLTAQEHTALDHTLRANHGDVLPEEPLHRLYTQPVGDEGAYANLGEWMLEMGHARPYTRKKKAKKK